mmetsp:Transcript_61793/g.151148  ORF Transcript_61793/g.151148 Transcript_61793/m.151148 type:complete len:309 (+) Transcript_61793:182-1108(+)
MNPTTFTNSTINSSSKKRRDCVNLLPSTYVPLNDTVIIGYGSGDIRHVEGNTRLETMVQMNLDEYSKTRRRADKARIISNIVDQIQTRCRRDGGHGYDEPAFVKFDGDNYWTITDRASREKVTSIFRNHLSHKYKSSSKWKTEKKRVIRKQRKEQQQRKQNPIVGTEDRTEITIGRSNVINGDSYISYHGHDDKLMASSWNNDVVTPKTTTVPMSSNHHHHVCFSARLCDIDDMMKEEATSESLLEQVSTTIFDGDKGDDIESNFDVTTTVLSVEDIKATGRRSFIELLPSKSVGAILPPIDDFSNIF